jgi:AraC-like DNA-binding protein
MKTRTIRATTGPSHWECVIAEIPPHLAPFVRGAMGYVERAAGMVRRRELPGPMIATIIDLGAPIRVYDGATPRRFRGGFVAGLDDRPTFCEHDGEQRGVQIDFTPVGARLFFGLPMSELAGRVVAIDELLPRAHRGLAERLSSLPTWDARLAYVVRLVEERLAELSGATKVVAWAVRRIEERGGAVDGRELARELGYSQKHVIHLFRDAVGVPPKQLARLVRFGRLVEILRSGRRVAWAQLASQLGWFDQSHMWRDIKRFAGATPSELLPELGDLAAIFDR